ncbi:unnamed protein product [Staurois parvus]|uniref:Uncharacterized protein n=1 Tax=Staurois parvus TaxID=386267 RepID=A0ABN9ECD8_9NEOB|nr:unnamed protein product [Staurois parvus]
MTSALSWDQLCAITADRMYIRKCQLLAFLSSQHSSDGTSTRTIRALIISALMISVAPSRPPVSAHQCHISVPI